MATPTAMKHGLSQQGRTPSAQGRTPSQLTGATPPVSTPFSNAAHAAFSPRNQRSSPQHVKKSPATSTLMGQPNMGALNFDSPSTAAAMGALGMGGSFDISLDGVSVGGLDTLTASFASEDEKLRRLDAILKLLNEKKGLVSEAGIERVAQRLGMELLSEEQTTADGRKTKTLAIAGSAIAMDIVLDNNIVQSAALSYHGSASAVSAQIDAASRILLKDLQLQPNQSPLTKTLDDFALNFERLARLDKLSIVPGLDCHEALAGLYTSLERLHQWDLQQLRQAPETSQKPDTHLNRMTMCSKHGNPVMHARKTVGLALQYWQQHHLAPASNSKPANEKVWSLLLGCAPIEGLGLPPVRVSDNWISKDIVSKIEGMDDATQPMMLDWQEPENISLPPSEENKDAGMEVLQADLSTTRVPRVMFTVTFDPPVVLPQNDWARLYSYAGVEPPPTTSEFGQPPPTFDALFFPVPSGSKQDPSEARTIAQTKEIRVFDKHGTASNSLCRNTLYIYKPIYSQEVSEMPFSHPRQLIDMLPLLRQYAFLSTLLQNGFMPENADKPEPADKNTASATNSTTIKDQLADFLSADDSASVEPSSSSLNLDTILWVHPSPHMQVVFPMGTTTANITLRILEGGTVEVVDENIIDGIKLNEGQKGITRADLARALEVFEDLSKWAEWIRTRLV